MKARTIAAVVFSLLAVASITFGCGDNSQPTTTPTPTPTSPTTTTLSTRLTVNGAISRSFTATQAGTVSVTLNNADGTTTVVGLGLGVPSTGVARCALTTAIVTAAGPTPQIAAPVDAGTYCVAVYDVGQLAGEITIDLTIAYP